MDVQHITIPLDELECFKEEDKYQFYLTQTLIYSTRATLHANHNKSRCSLLITKHTLWLEQDGHKRKKKELPLSSISGLVKAEEQPEFVILTIQTQDNLRISTANEQRTSHIISALSFYFTHLAKQKKSLQVYTIKQNSLLYFERTVKEKKNGPNLSLQRYPQYHIDYEEPNQSPDIVGKLVIHKLILSKQLYVEGNYMMHLASVNQKEYYLCHTIQKTQELIQSLSNHKNIERVQKLQYAKKLDFKIQIFFQFLPSLKPRTLKVTDLFEQLYTIYDLVRQYNSKGFITPHMLLRSSQDSKKLMLREFRYPCLIFDYQYNSFIYQKIHKQSRNEDYIINKMFNLGLILYHYLFGRNPFEHQDLEFTLHLKNHLTQIAFPKTTPQNYSKKVQLFIQKCILGKFHSPAQIQRDPWIQLNNIHL